MSARPDGTSTIAGWLASPPATAAIEIASDSVTSLSLAGRVVQAHAVADLAPGTVTPALNGGNVQNPAALSAAIRAAVDAFTPSPRRVALVLPDTVGKVSVLRFEQVPARHADLDQLIRWQVRKAAPFNIDEAQVSWIAGASLDGAGQEFVVTVVRRDVIGEYESACAAAGLHAGVVDLATFNLINTVLATTPDASVGDWLLVHLAGDYATLAVMRGADLVFFRNRSGEDTAELADLVHQTAMYHEDRLGGGGFTRVVMTGAALRDPVQAARLRGEVQERLGAAIGTLDLKEVVTLSDRISPSPDLVDRLGPALGVLLRERVA